MTESLRAVVDRMRREQEARRVRATERHAALDAALADLHERVGILERERSADHAALLMHQAQKNAHKG